MTKTPCQLIFKRSQTKGGKPRFTLTVLAEMTSEFERATREYGMWSNIIYADPRLDEYRELQAQKADRKYQRSARFANAVTSNISGTTAIFLLPYVLFYKIIKLLFVVPFKLLFWILKAFRQQKKQVMRFAELKLGKSFTTTDLAELVQIEETVTEAVESVKTYVAAAGNYEGEVVAVTPA